MMDRISSSAVLQTVVIVGGWIAVGAIMGAILAMLLGLIK